MTRYRVQVRPSAAKSLAKLEARDGERIRGAIALLAENPRPPGSRVLQGRPGLRVRVGDYRIVYTVDDGELVILVVALGHRRDVYR